MKDTCSCGAKLKIKDHGTWIGYHCFSCGSGGSTKKKFAPRQRSFVSRYSKIVSVPIKVENSQITTIDIRPDFYNKERKHFTLECSEVNIGYPGQQVILRNPKTNNEMMFTFYKRDLDATNEDTFGWHYKSGEYELLIIND